MISRLGRLKCGYSIPVLSMIVVGVAALAFAIARYAWTDWTLYAVAVSAFVLLGGVRFWPWEMLRARPVGIGLLLGLVAAAFNFFLIQAR